MKLRGEAGDDRGGSGSLVAPTTTRATFNHWLLASYPGDFAISLVSLSESESAWRNWSTEKSTSANTKNFAILKM